MRTRKVGSMEKMKKQTWLVSMPIAGIATMYVEAESEQEAIYAALCADQDFELDEWSALHREASAEPIKCEEKSE
jgi:hypothetical protein